MRLVLRVDPNDAVVSDQADVRCERSHRRHAALPPEGPSGLDEPRLPKAELRSERTREAADPRLPYISHLEIPRESVKRSGATEPALVGDPAHRLERMRDERFEDGRDCRRRAPKRSLTDVMLKRPCAFS